MIEVLIQIYLSCWFFTNFSPIQKAINYIFILKEELNWIEDSIFTILGCQQCLTFWVVLIVTFNPFYAFGLSALAQIHKKLIHI